ncbi:MAG: type II secretion system protein N [Pseudomonadales bacterium]
MFNFPIEQLNRPITIAAWVIVAGTVLYLVVQNLFFYLDAGLAGAVKLTPSAPTQEAVISSNGPSVQTRELFGRLGASGPAEPVEAPTTRLNLELQGVFLSELETASSAIVAERGKNGKLYQVGEKLPGNVTLHAVNADHILLRRGTRLEKLLFISKRLNIRASDTASNRNTATSKARSSRIAGNANLIPSAQQPSDQGSSATLSEVRDRLLRNPKKLLKDYGLSAVSEGSPKGYKVDSAHPALAGTGLQPGDRVVSVNGAPLGTAMNDVRLIDQARSAGRVRVEVERGGRRFFLTIPIP